MSNYLKHKSGSLEDVISQQPSQKFAEDSGYQKMFKKELDAAGKGVGSMSPKEKKSFFNNIDSKYKAKNESKEVKDKDIEEAMPGGANSASKKGSVWKAAKKKRFGVKVGQHEPKGNKLSEYEEEKLAEEAKDIAVGERIPFKNLSETIKDMWVEAANGKEKKKDVAPVEPAETKEGMETMVPDKKDADKKEKTPKKAMTGEKSTKVETEPEIEYK